MGNVAVSPQRRICSKQRLTLVKFWLVEKISIHSAIPSISQYHNSIALPLTDNDCIVVAVAIPPDVLLIQIRDLNLLDVFLSNPSCINRRRCKKTHLNWFAAALVVQFINEWFIMYACSVATHIRMCPERGDINQNTWSQYSTVQ